MGNNGGEDKGDPIKKIQKNVENAGIFLKDILTHSRESL